MDKVVCTCVAPIVHPLTRIRPFPVYYVSWFHSDVAGVAKQQCCDRFQLFNCGIHNFEYQLVCEMEFQDS
jgi:hypothetical protein